MSAFHPKRTLDARRRLTPTDDKVDPLGLAAIHVTGGVLDCEVRGSVLVCVFRPEIVVTGFRNCGAMLCGGYSGGGVRPRTPREPGLGGGGIGGGGRGGGEPQKEEDGVATNGCGRSGGPSIRLFEACNKHDVCYAASQVNRKTCDNNFLKDMRRECYALPPTPAQGGCFSIAYFFYGLVRVGGKDAFDDARRGPDLRRFYEYLEQYRREGR